MVLTSWENLAAFYQLSSDDREILHSKLKIKVEPPNAQVYLLTQSCFCTRIPYGLCTHDGLINEMVNVRSNDITQNIGTD